ncbi:MAG: hypothetical protein ACRDJU_11440, partial [Actinomycetota bacterium]
MAARSNVYGYDGGQATLGARARILLGQTMGLVACTAGVFTLGAYLGRHLTSGVGLVCHLRASAYVIGMRFAVRS